VPDKDLYYVPNGTKAAPNGTETEPHVRPEGALNADPNLVMVGRVSVGKGVDLAILALLELHRRRGPRCPHLNIYGGGRDRFGIKYYTEMVAVLGLSEVIKFHGPQLDVLSCCSRSDILVVPSRDETGPLVVLEAMSRGMPIVSADVGDVAEMLPDHRYGRIVPVNSIVMLTDAIDSTLSDIENGRFDPQLLIKRHQALYTTEKLADRVESAYREILVKSCADSGAPLRIGSPSDGLA